MAYSLQCSCSFVIFLSLVMAILFVSPTYSTSRHRFSHSKKQIGFRVSLKHVDDGKNLTKFEKVQHAMKRGRNRLQRLNAMPLTVADSDSDIQSPIHVGRGEFLMELAIGTPPLSYSAIMDTGSDLVWTQCEPCQECFDQPTPIFDPRNSSSFSKISCSSKLCETLPMSTCDDGCQYLYSYGDYSATQGVMATDTFTFGKVSIPNIGFGCGSTNEGNGLTQGAGLVGLGRGPLSLVSQLSEPKFSYCLTSIDATKTSTLMLGSIASVNNTQNPTAITTPLIRNPKQPSFYYLPLKGITVGDTRLPIKKSTFGIKDDGTGGIIIDSGTTITYLEGSAFHMVQKEFISQVNLTVDNSNSTGLELCFSLPPGTSDVAVPKLIFHFEGADLDLPAENYMIADTSVGVLCLAMGSSTGLSIFGNVQQQNMLVLHDLQEETLSFIPTQCDQL